MNRLELWNRYRQHLCRVDSIGLSLDISRMMFDDGFIETMQPRMIEALTAMDALEGGAIANPDENRMVGHYWLRTPERAPDQAITREIQQSIETVRTLAREVHDGVVKPERGEGFFIVLLIGIGGSALGPQLLADALGSSDDPMLIRFLDNTDPGGIDRTIAEIDDNLEATLTIVVSKSGGTKETRNAMLEVADAYRKRGLDFARHVVAITQDGSALHTLAVKDKWLRTVPIWDWVGGRTSVTSAVGLLPAALIGVDIDALLAGAQACDEATRNHDIARNPAALMAMMWHHAGGGHGDRSLVVLPYCDRLALLGKYLQQLVMESLGKQHDRGGAVVHQGLTVYGNKGSTDQHAYVQQLRDGRNDFFATFIEVLRLREGPSIEVEPGITTGDYLFGLLRGTREALTEAGRPSITLTLDKLDAGSMGALIALFERTVGLYAELINVNAYHQPGVEAGKKAAAGILDQQASVMKHLRDHKDRSWTAEAIADALGSPEAVEMIEHILVHLSADPSRGIAREGSQPSGSSHRFNE